MQSILDIFVILSYFILQVLKQAYFSLPDVMWLAKTSILAVRFVLFSSVQMQIQPFSFYLHIRITNFILGMA